MTDLTEDGRRDPRVEPDPLKPSLTLLVKLGSLAVHAEELLSSKAHAYDRIAAQQILTDPEVIAWLEQMGAYVPVKR